MTHELPPLPYAKDALQPYLSQETLEYHHGKHHAAYVTNLNKLIPGTEFENLPLEEIIKKATGGIFNNAAQVWNHSFFWNCLAPHAGGEPSGPLADALRRDFGDFAQFKDKFTNAATSLFGSGWTWLVRSTDGRLSIEQTSNAMNPLKEGGKKALLTCDVWEHAYYIDYRNARAKYVEAFWNLVNWPFIARQFQA
jgi:Fe-Mn family superoxide dismutase